MRRRRRRRRRRWRREEEPARRPGSGSGSSSSLDRSGGGEKREFHAGSGSGRFIRNGSISRPPQRRGRGPAASAARRESKRRGSEFEGPSERGKTEGERKWCVVGKSGRGIPAPGVRERRDPTRARVTPSRACHVLSLSRSHRRRPQCGRLPPELLHHDRERLRVDAVLDQADEERERLPFFVVGECGATTPLPESKRGWGPFREGSGDRDARP